MEYWKMMDARNEYLKTVEAGQMVSIQTHYGSLIEAKVVKTTVNHIIVEAGAGKRRFKREGGDEWGTQVSRYIRDVIITPAAAAERRALLNAEKEHNELIGKMNTFSQRAFGIQNRDLLAKVVEAMEAAQKELEGRNKAFRKWLEPVTKLSAFETLDQAGGALLKRLSLEKLDADDEAAIKDAFQIIASRRDLLHTEILGGAQ